MPAIQFAKNTHKITYKTTIKVLDNSNLKKKIYAKFVTTKFNRFEKAQKLITYKLGHLHDIEQLEQNDSIVHTFLS